MDKTRKVNILGVVAVVLIIVFIFTLITSAENKSNKKITKRDINIDSAKQIQQTELTFETLRRYKGFENICEIEAPEQIETIKRLAKVLYYLHMNENSHNTIKKYHA